VPEDHLDASGHGHGGGVDDQATHPTARGGAASSPESTNACSIVSIRR
jgi:hypothetical protein